jgi:hypothetical protein
MFTAKIAKLQEDTLMALTTCKYMERWYERAQQAIERINTLMQSNRAKIKKNTTSRCWEKVVLIA